MLLRGSEAKGPLPHPLIPPLGPRLPVSKAPFFSPPPALEARESSEEGNHRQAPGIYLLGKRDKTATKGEILPPNLEPAPYKQTSQHFSSSFRPSPGAQGLFIDRRFGDVGLLFYLVAIRVLVACRNCGPSSFDVGGAKYSDDPDTLQLISTTTLRFDGPLTSRPRQLIVRTFPLH